MATMQMKYIFLRKNNVFEKDSIMASHNVTFTKMLGVLFKNVTNNSFDVEVEEYLYIINYQLSSNKSGDTYYLTLTIKGKVSQCAKILNEVNIRLLKGSHRREYNIVLTFDCISHYYCNKIYPKFNYFERKIRELILRILIKSHGNDWYEVTFPQELKNELKKQGLKQCELIERALSEITISQLEMYLFEPFRIIETDNVIDDQLNKSSVNKMTKEEIIEIIDLCRARSLWERFFKGIKIDNLQENLDIIRKYRNNVAHSKYFYKEDYIKCNRILNKLIKQIENAIETIDAKPYSLIDIGKTFSALAGTIALLYVPTLKSIIESSKIDIPYISTRTAEQIKAISKSSNMISTQIAGQMKLISEASKISMPKISTKLAEQMKLISEASNINMLKISTQMAEQIKAISESSKMISTQISEQMKLISEASKISMPKISTQLAEQMILKSEDSKISKPKTNEQLKEGKDNVFNSETNITVVHDEEMKNTGKFNNDKDIKNNKTKT